MPVCLFGVSWFGCWRRCGLAIDGVFGSGMGLGLEFQFLVGRERPELGLPGRALAGNWAEIGLAGYW